MIPKRRADAEVSGRKLMMAGVVLEQRGRQIVRAVVCAMMDKQIPGISYQRACKEGASGDQIDKRETNPYLPEDSQDRVVGIGVVQPVLRWHEIMQHETVNGIFAEGPRDDATGEKCNGETHSEGRGRNQNDRKQGSNCHFPEIDDGGHEATLGAISLHMQCRVGRRESRLHPGRRSNLGHASRYKTSD
jgi:hypothetical protein